MSSEHDAAGLETLERFARAPAFNQWLYGSIAGHCSGRILEIGSGIGNISRLLLNEHSQVTLSDLRQVYCDKLQERFGQHPHFEQAVRLDIAEEDLAITHPSLLQRFDTVIALNVVEHIKDDAKAISNCYQLLRPGGRLIVLVPAYQWLFNSFDTELGHYKRYTLKGLKALLGSAEMDTVHTRYFNAAGIPGWWMTGTIMKKKTIPEAQLRVFEKLVPLFRVLDKLVFRKLGLSAIAVAVKRSK